MKGLVEEIRGYIKAYYKSGMIGKWGTDIEEILSRHQPAPVDGKSGQLEKESLAGNEEV